MNKLKYLIISGFALFIMNSAQAVMIDFQAMADGSYGESAWQPLNLSSLGVNVDIYGVSGGSTVYAYLDSTVGGTGPGSGPGGLGVCKEIVSETCSPSSDDNVTSGELLRFVFNEAVTIGNIWFNNNHDTDYSLDGDTIEIGNISYTFSGSGAAGPHGGTDWLYSMNGAFNAGDELLISYHDNIPLSCQLFGGPGCSSDEFYISRMEITGNVPEPGSLALMGLGLLGLGALRRRQVK